MTDQISASFRCPKCGPTSIRVEDKTNDACPVTCATCGVGFGAWGDVKGKATEVAADALRGMLRDSVKGLKGWKVT